MDTSKRELPARITSVSRQFLQYSNDVRNGLFRCQHCLLIEQQNSVLFTQCEACQWLGYGSILREIRALKVPAHAYDNILAAKDITLEITEFTHYVQPNNAAGNHHDLWVTMRISLISVALSIPLGILFGMFMTLKNPISRAVSRVYLEFVRIMPRLVLLFIAYFGVTRAFAWNLSADVSPVLVFVLWGTAEMGDLVWGALISIPKHQYDSASALGMTKTQTFVHVIVPQTLRRLIPLTINLTTRMIKTTSLVVLIGITEVQKVGKQIIDVNRFDYHRPRCPEGKHHLAGLAER